MSAVTPTLNLGLSWTQAKIKVNLLLDWSLMACLSAETEMGTKMPQDGQASGVHLCLVGGELAHLLLQPPIPPHANPPHLVCGLVHWCFPSKGASAVLCWLQGFKGEILAWSGVWTKPGFNYPALSPSPERAMNRACGSWLCLSPSTLHPLQTPAFRSRPPSFM